METSDDGSRWPRGTIGLALAILVVYAAELALGLETTPGVALLRTGATEHGAVFVAGEWWRLLAAGFVHMGLLHLLLNGISLIQLGALVEGFYGTARMLVVYFASVVGGCLLSSCWGDRLSAGASGGIMGLLGFLIAGSYLHAPAVRAALRETFGRQLLFWGFVCFALGAFPQLAIDNRGHFGGLVAGFALGAVLRGVEPPGMLVRGLAFAFVFACGWAAVEVATRGDESARIGAALEAVQSAAEADDVLAADRAVSELLSGPGASLPRAIGLSYPRARWLIDAALVCSRTEVALAAGEVAARVLGPPGEGLLGAALLRAGETEKARAALLRCEKGALPEEQSDVAALVERAGGSRQAVHLLDSALRRDPGNGTILNSLAWTLLTARDETARDYPRALELARRANEVAPENPGVLDTLAEAELHAGRIAPALAHEEHAVELTRAARDPGLLRQLEPRLEKLRGLAKAKG